MSHIFFDEIFLQLVTGVESSKVRLNLFLQFFELLFLFGVVGVGILDDVGNLKLKPRFGANNFAKMFEIGTIFMAVAKKKTKIH